MNILKYMIWGCSVIFIELYMRVCVSLLFKGPLPPTFKQNNF